MKAYKSQIIDVIKNLIEIRHNIFDQIINFALENELSDINETFYEGEVYNFSLAQFKDSADVNLIKLVELCETIENTTMSLMNIIDIKEEELGLDDV